MWIKPKYIRWRDWLLWLLCLPRAKKQELDSFMCALAIMRPLLRGHPGIERKIEQGESCSWSISREEATESLKAVEEYVKIAATISSTGEISKIEEDKS